MKIIPGQIVADPGEHVVLTGPITGSVTTADGESFDVSDPGVVVPDDKVAEVAHLIGARYEAEGHPLDPDYTYDAPKEFAKYEAHSDNATLSKES